MLNVSDCVRVIRYMDNLEIVGKDGKIVDSRISPSGLFILYSVVIDGEKFEMYEDELEKEN
jgi:hypothetical protein